MMRAVQAPEPGGPDALQLLEIETPRPGPGQLLIRVAAAGINRPDVFQRQGFYPPPEGAPVTLGLEASGIVVAAGSDVDGFSVGDEVFGLIAGGGYADYCLIDAPLAASIPQGVSLIDAAGLPENFFTVWTNVFEDARLVADETLLVHGGTSGIGVAAIQLAKAFGARVVATCGADEKCATAQALGADLAINYRREDFVAAVKDFGGADVVLDMVGGDYFDRNLKCLKRGGRHVSIAFLKGSRIEADLMPVMLKRLRLTGSTLRARPLAQKAEIAAALHAQVWPKFADGGLRPVTDSTFPLSEAARAHARMEESAHRGKILLIP